MVGNPLGNGEVSDKEVMDKVWQVLGFKEDVYAGNRTR